MKTMLIFLLSVTLWAGWQRSGGSVIDPSGKLQWEDDPAAQSRDSVWRDAKKYCASLDLDGFYDWRLPTRDELHALIDAVHAGEVTVNYSAMNAYWTSEINRKMPINAWAVFWGNGHTFDDDKCDEAHVRCVRNR
jgi:hypothetical protein